jgi:hypothetical protein
MRQRMRRAQALKTARELWAYAIKAGKSLGADAIVIADEHGQLTFVPMADALPKRSQPPDSSND